MDEPILGQGSSSRSLDKFKARGYAVEKKM